AAGGQGSIRVSGRDYLPRKEGIIPFGLRRIKVGTKLDRFGPRNDANYAARNFGGLIAIELGRHSCTSVPAASRAMNPLSPPLQFDWPDAKQVVAPAQEQPAVRDGGRGHNPFSHGTFAEQFEMLSDARGEDNAIFACGIEQSIRHDGRGIKARRP